MKKILLALAAVSTLAAAVPASAEYIHVKNTGAYNGGVGIPNDGSIPYETGEWVKVSIPFGANTWNSYKVNAGDKVAYSKYYFPINTLGNPGDQDPWYEYVIPAGYDLHLTFAGTLFNQILDVKIAPTTDVDSPNWVDPNPKPAAPVEKYVKPIPTKEGFDKFIKDINKLYPNGAPDFPIFGN